MREAEIILNLVSEASMQRRHYSKNLREIRYKPCCSQVREHSRQKEEQVQASRKRALASYSFYV